jgi:hypothetical protein
VFGNGLGIEIHILKSYNSEQSRLLQRANLLCAYGRKFLGAAAHYFYFTLQTPKMQLCIVFYVF